MVLRHLSAATENMRWTTRSSFIFVCFRLMNGCIVRSLPTMRSVCVEFFHWMFFSSVPIRMTTKLRLALHKQMKRYEIRIAMHESMNATRHSRVRASHNEREN